MDWRTCGDKGRPTQLIALMTAQMFESDARYCRIVI